ncbi:SpaH/EbpB family LPXTG-anchored major pilin [Glutamicibacter sp. ZJUTW]|uniref:SpaH/EbpB family LPXTG-anchored major pilin n=1 Tax=Glutamicibacter sp. ZJUTW TaxID=1155384 RepID=UPI00143DFC01|nr:SpaH/EbpB family LPXTG-anchored major pilin [Glutamicibacter sp. ZJUTW]
MFTQRRLGKLVAGASALALAGMGLFGVAAASADEVSDITPGTKGSIIVHKSSADPVAGLNNGTLLDPDPGFGKGLDGVEFTLQPVLFDGDLIDLSTAEGWELAEALPSETAGEALPEGYSLGTGVPQTTVGGVATFSGLELGLYLVTETDSGNNLINAAAAPFYVSIPYPNADSTWNYNVHVYPKNTLNTIHQHKTVDDTAKLLGDVVTWTLVTDVPASDLPYKSYTLTDNLSANLEFISWESVSIGTLDLDLDVHYEVSDDKSVITLTPLGLEELDDAGATTVTAILKTKVVSIPEGGVIENTAAVNINGTPDQQTTNTNLGTLQLEKKAEGENGALLDGAVFELYGTEPDADGNATSAPIGEAKTTVDGKITWELHLGIEQDMQSSYWVKETKAPAGYVLPADPWSDELVVINGQILVETITNHKPTGPDLPLTGASGTVLFTIAGVGLMAAAGGAVLVKRRRARTQG